MNMTKQELEDWLQVRSQSRLPLLSSPSALISHPRCQTEDSTSSGWSKNDGSGESVGHDSGRHIVKILEKNPSKDPGRFGNPPCFDEVQVCLRDFAKFWCERTAKYDEEDIAHMRKVS